MKGPINLIKTNFDEVNKQFINSQVNALLGQIADSVNLIKEYQSKYKEYEDQVLQWKKTISEFKEVLAIDLAEQVTLAKEAVSNAKAFSENLVSGIVALGENITNAIEDKRYAIETDLKERFSSFFKNTNKTLQNLSDLAN